MDIPLINLLMYPWLLNIEMLELGDKFRGVLDQEPNCLKVIARRGKVLIDIKVDVIEESSPLEDPWHQVSNSEQLSLNGWCSDGRLEMAQLVEYTTK